MLPFWDSRTIWFVICSSGRTNAEVRAASGSKVVTNFMLMTLMSLMKLEEKEEREEGRRKNKLDVA